MAWNDLTPAQQAAWKKKNFNSNVKVPQSAIDKLMKGGTKSANIKKYAGTDSKVMREAMNRFYGKGWDKGGSGGGGKPGTKPYKPGPKNDRPSIKDVPRGPVRSPRAIEGGAGYSAPKKGGSSSKPLTKYEREYKKMTGVLPGQKTKKTPISSVTPTMLVNRVSDKKAARAREMVGALATVAGVGGVVRGGVMAGGKLVGAAAAKRAAAKKAAEQAAKSTAKSTVKGGAKGGAKGTSRVGSRPNRINQQDRLRSVRDVTGKNRPGKYGTTRTTRPTSGGRRLKAGKL